MLFTSLVFLFYFLPLLLVIYYISKKNIRNYVLFIFSLLFYAWGGVSYSLVLIGSLIVNYIFVVQINKKQLKAKSWLTVGIVFNIIVLIIFKYLDFIIENINGFTGYLNPESITILPINIVLPLGISFYTFQQMSMLWDTYKNPKSEKIYFLHTALYTSFFPQLIAGPIVRYNDIIAQIKSRKESVSLFTSGVERFIIGLFKKIILANTMAELADTIMNSPFESYGFSAAWLGIIAYSLQIYFDFSGYSDMAIGLGRMFGFKILENFNYPYISTSIKEFWRRWHISLSSWFKDYVYIPVGGNRKGNSRTYFNLLIVFILTGFWHGATWSFVFWGVFHGLFIILERLGLDKILLKLPFVIRWIYTLVIVMIGWVYFRIEDFTEANNYVIKLFSFTSNENELSFIYHLNKEYIFVLILAFLISSSWLFKIKELLFKTNSNIIQNFYMVIKQLALICIFIYCIIYINSGSYNPFIYFRF